MSGDDPAAPPIDIAALKSVRPYRAAFMFPEVGNAGVVAVEDASRTHASKKLEQWLRHWSREDAEAVAAAQREQTGKKSIRAEWWSMRLTPMSDPERLKRLMLNGTSSKIVLTKQGASDSNTPGKSPLKVEMGLDDGKYAKQARMLINKWIAHFNGPPAERASDPQGAATRDLAAVLADRYMGFDDEAYDDAWIEVKDSDGKKKEISPSRWADIFIYPVGSGIECPSRAIFFGRVQKAVAPLEKSLEVKIDWAGWGVDDG
ncbi:hypothetical protein [Mycolicibacterium sp. CBMA 234]|uniref:hypothetical protein n=1 Tax=Mycolicibacterium sp. CBMA 234 TaxID=1918495 RepID=UPI0012DD51D9|nr:hypothetical protein [Mycolicibacterium sp. CBMA 234]